MKDLTPIEFKFDFFIAHAGADLPPAERLYDLLQPSTVFLDSRSLELGDDWDRELPLAQQTSMVTVVLVSSNTDRAYYQREEIAAAIALARKDDARHRVVPVYLDTRDESGVPYGLLGKHGLEASRDGDLEGIAVRLKESLSRIKAKLNNSEEFVTDAAHPSPRFHRVLVAALAALSEDDLLPDVIVPLLTILNPGRIDYAFIPKDPNRFVLSFGTNKLKRPHTICVQLKPISSRTEAIEFAKCARSVEIARSQGLKTEAGQLVVPNEAWLITPNSLTEDFRRRSETDIAQLNKKNIQLVSGEELAGLLVEYVPEIASKLSKYSQPEIVGLISALSKHAEGKAFGVSSDRDINEFYVTTALSPYARRAYAAIRNEIVVKNAQLSEHLSIGNLLEPSDLFLPRETLQKRLEDNAIQQITEGSLDGLDVPIEVKMQMSLLQVQKYFTKRTLLDSYHFLNLSRFLLKLKAANDPFSAYLRDALPKKTKTLLDEYDGHSEIEMVLRRGVINSIQHQLRSESFYEEVSARGFTILPSTKRLRKKATTPELVMLANRILLGEGYSRELAKIENMHHDDVKVTLSFDFESAFLTLIDETRKAISDCPEVLSEDASPVRNAWVQLERTERFVRILADHFGTVSSEHALDEDVVVTSPIRVRIPRPAHLLNVDKVLLVEGPPGCGKTTLLKILAIDMLSRNRKVRYLPCFNIAPSYKKKSLDRLVEKFSQGSGVTPQEYQQSILIIDGLDEAPFDISTLILSGFKQFDHIIVSTRTAYETKLRSEFFRIELAPFTNEERDIFFEKWFNSDVELVSQARELISKYPDLDNHTRLPLIASITASLLQNGIIPRTRAEIYGFRLDLLLSRWDKARGVKRLYVDNSEAKRRFLRELAWKLHSADGRQRNIDELSLRNVYEHSLGSWGYNVSFEDVLKDLVVGSGVLIEERRGIYSLGHLTFQEHLVGEYLTQNYPINQVALLMADDWWQEPLNFYASIKGDITQLLTYMIGDTGFLANAKQLMAMASYAPYTSPGAVQALSDFVSDPTSDNFS